jgi:hypothetical protein
MQGRCLLSIFHTCRLVEAGIVAKSSRANVQEIEEIRKQIQKAGVRATPARITALQLLRAATTPLISR